MRILFAIPVIVIGRNHWLPSFWLHLNVIHTILTRTASTVSRIGINRTYTRFQQPEEARR